MDTPLCHTQRDPPLDGPAPSLLPPASTGSTWAEGVFGGQKGAQREGGPGEWRSFLKGGENPKVKRDPRL